MKSKKNDNRKSLHQPHSSKEETRHFYNAIAEETFSKWFTDSTLLSTLKNLIDRLPENPKILDLGCGTGGESKRLCDLGAEVTGIDFSDDSIRFARENVPEARFITEDILNFDFESYRFDGIIEASVLFHFTQFEQDQILRGILKSLNPKGIFQSYYPAGNFEGMQNMEFSGQCYRRYSRQLAKEKWIEQVLEAGFCRYCEYQFDVGNFSCIAFSR